MMRLQVLRQVRRISDHKRDWTFINITSGFDATTVPVIMSGLANINNLYCCKGQDAAGVMYSYSAGTTASVSDDLKVDDQTEVEEEIIIILDNNHYP